MSNEFTRKRIEAALSQIGAKISLACDLAREMTESGVRSEKLLAEAQNDLSELYISLDAGQICKNCDGEK